MTWRDDIVFPIIRNGKIEWPPEATEQDKRDWVTVLAWVSRP